MLKRTIALASLHATLSVHTPEIARTPQTRRVSLVKATSSPMPTCFTVHAQSRGSVTCLATALLHATEKFYTTVHCNVLTACFFGRGSDRAETGDVFVRRLAHLADALLLLRVAVRAIAVPPRHNPVGSPQDVYTLRKFDDRPCTNLRVFNSTKRAAGARERSENLHRAKHAPQCNRCGREDRGECRTSFGDRGGESYWKQDSETPHHQREPATPPLRGCAPQRVHLLPGSTHRHRSCNFLGCLYTARDQ